MTGTLLFFMHCMLFMQMTVCDLENSTLLRQRRELQLLMAELKDRDQELNNMAAAHHTQLLAWQQDRQRVLSLEERCARLEGELMGGAVS